MLLTTIFCKIDDFCKFFDRSATKKNIGKSIKRGLPCSLSSSKIVTIVIYFHIAGKRNFKNYYRTYIKGFLSNAFPKAPSYNRFVELMPRALIYLDAYMQTEGLDEFTGIGYIDSTAISVCKNLRISSHKVFKGIASRAKTSTGWFYGFKLHLIINERGGINAYAITKGNVDDRNRGVLDRLLKKFKGKLFGDRGYLSEKLFKDLFQKGVSLFTRVKNKMQNKLIGLEEKFLLSRRGLIESVNDLLKNESQIEHTRHRSGKNFLVNLISGLVAYTFRDKKPSLNGFSEKVLTFASY